MQYLPTFDSIKSHPLPGWFDDAKLGIFVHWGVYSVPAFAPLKKNGISDEEAGITADKKWSHSPYAEWYQNSLRIHASPAQAYHRQKYGADFRYEQFADTFNEEIKKWNPEAMANLFARAGARYVVLTSKHHDGFLLWHSRTPNPRNRNWQACRDIVRELTQAVSARGMKMGLYYSSLLDWTFTKTPITCYEEMIASSDTGRAYMNYVETHWLELIERYNPWILWSDIGYPPGYHLPKLWAHYYNRKPEGVVNDRWMQLPKIAFNRLGRFVIRKYIETARPTVVPNPTHNDYVTPEYTIFDRIMPYKWETCRGIGNSFGYNQFEDASHYATADDLIRLLVDIVSKNGNLLLNVGPRADGSIHPLQVEALEGLGAWLKVNGESIYGTRPWIRHTDSDDGGAEVRYTAKDGALYVIVTQQPKNGKFSLPRETVEGRVTLLETGDRLRVERSAEGKSVVEMPAWAQSNAIPVIKIQIS